MDVVSRSRLHLTAQTPSHVLRLLNSAGSYKPSAEDQSTALRAAVTNGIPFLSGIFSGFRVGQLPRQTYVAAARTVGQRQLGAQQSALGGLRLAEGIRAPHGCAYSSRRGAFSGARVAPAGGISRAQIPGAEEAGAAVAEVAEPANGGADAGEGGRRRNSQGKPRGGAGAGSWQEGEAEQWVRAVQARGDSSGEGTVGGDRVAGTRKPRKGEELELVCDSLAFKGLGVCRVPESGFVVLCERALPGERLVARIVKAKRQYAEAYKVHVLSPHDHATTPRCQHFGHCGGCRLQNLEYEAQLRIKQQQVGGWGAGLGTGYSLPLLFSPIYSTVSPVFHSFFHPPSLTLSPFLTLSHPLFPSSHSLRPWGFALGLHAPRRFDKVLPIEECHLQHPTANEILVHVRQWSEQHQHVLPPYDPITHEGVLRHLTIRKGRDELTGEEEFMVVLVTKTDCPDLLQPLVDHLSHAFPRLVSFIMTVNSSLADATPPNALERLLLGRRVISDSLRSLHFDISAASFFQTNSDQAEVLYELVEQACALKGDGSELLLDLFCGTGTIGLSLASRVRHVYGFELVPEAIADARRNADRNGITNATFLTVDLNKALPTLPSAAAAGDNKPDVIITDPNRPGMHPRLLEHMAEVRAPRIVYVSCNPSSMARDLHALCHQLPSGRPGPYRLEWIQPVDMKKPSVEPFHPRSEVCALIRGAPSSLRLHPRCALVSAPSSQVHPRLCAFIPGAPSSLRLHPRCALVSAPSSEVRPRLCAFIQGAPSSLRLHPRCALVSAPSSQLRPRLCAFIPGAPSSLRHHPRVPSSLRLHPMCALVFAPSSEVRPRLCAFIRGAPSSLRLHPKCALVAAPSSEVRPRLCAFIRGAPSSLRLHPRCALVSAPSSQVRPRLCAFIPGAPSSLRLHPGCALVAAPSSQVRPRLCAFIPGAPSSLRLHPRCALISAPSSQVRPRRCAFIPGAPSSLRLHPRCALVSAPSSEVRPRVCAFIRGAPSSLRLHPMCALVFAPSSEVRPRLCAFIRGCSRLCAFIRCAPSSLRLHPKCTLVFAPSSDVRPRLCAFIPGAPSSLRLHPRCALLSAPSSQVRPHLCAVIPGAPSSLCLHPGCALIAAPPSQVRPRLYAFIRGAPSSLRLHPRVPSSLRLHPMCALVSAPSSDVRPRLCAFIRGAPSSLRLLPRCALVSAPSSQVRPPRCAFIPGAPSSLRLHPRCALVSAPSSQLRPRLCAFIPGAPSSLRLHPGCALVAAPSSQVRPRLCAFIRGAPSSLRLHPRCALVSAPSSQVRPRLCAFIPAAPSSLRLHPRCALVAAPSSRVRPRRCAFIQVRPRLCAFIPGAPSSLRLHPRCALVSAPSSEVRPRLCAFIRGAPSSLRLHPRCALVSAPSSEVCPRLCAFIRGAPSSLRRSHLTATLAPVVAN
ncbi:unnamed protein product [Closterium sp. NIES-64]|nr:unnamed protein product [Closterium sp. NIES-64]